MNTKKMTRILCAGIFVLSLISCGGGGSSSSATDENRTGETKIIAATGGTVKFNNEMILNIPAESLAEDTTITIEHTADLPQKFDDGYQPVGQAYSCKPGGTEFTLDNPAVMELFYDETAIKAKGLDPRTLTLFYYDEENGKYVAVESKVDLDNKKLIAHVEHFTVYLPLAQSMLATNNPPTIALQNPVPSTIRAGAPIYLRATIRDNDSGGSIVSPKVYYRKRHPSVDSWQTLAMKKEVRPNSFDTYTATVPASYLDAASMGSGNDFEYYVDVYDNLGAHTQSSTRGYNVTRTLNASSITINPTSRTVAAGFESLFTVRGRDSSNSQFQFIPDSYTVSNSLGTLKNYGTQGVYFLAQKKGTGNLTVTAGSASKTAAITVNNGELAALEILDTNGLPFTSEFRLSAGSSYDFDVIGYDEFNNTSLVLPVWSCDAALGSIDQNGRLTTTATSANGTVTVRLGDITATRWVRVLSTAKDMLTFSIAGWAGTISAPYINVRISETVDIHDIAPVFSSNGTRVLVDGDEQTSGTSTQDFSDTGSPVVYTVFAEDGSSRDYTVTITKLSSAKEITSFAINGVNGIIPGTDIEIILPIGTDLTSLTATFTASAGASVNIGGVVQQSGVTVNNFSSPATYTVTAEDGSIKAYTVTVRLTDTTTPSAITALTDLSSSASGITFSWTDPADADFDHVLITCSDGANSVSATVLAGTQTFTQGSLSASKKYILTLQSVDTSGNVSSPYTFGVQTPASGSITITKIASASDLYNVRNAPSGNYFVTADISLSAYPSWTPGTLTGSFNGNNHTISDLKITSTVSQSGLFGSSSGVISNVNLANVSISGYYTNTGAYVGGLAGVSSGPILHCTISGTITTGSSPDINTDIGGLIGKNGGIISDCDSTVKVTESSTGSGTEVGGLVGNNTGTMTNCHATGEVFGQSNGFNAVGGLIGNNGGTLSYCYATGSVTGEPTDVGPGTAVGGLIGVNTGTMTYCYATGSISSSSNSKIGGLIGVNDGTMTNCYATGSISSSGNGKIGGLIGVNHGTMTNCYATGSITGESDGFFEVGGLNGHNTGTMTYCYATGSVSFISYIGSSGFVGGLIGNNGGTLSYCYATGSINYTGTTANSYVGGLIGRMYFSADPLIILDCYALGNISYPAKSVCGGLIGCIEGNNVSLNITNSYAIGHLNYTGTGANPGSGFVGKNDGTNLTVTVSSCYFDQDTVGVSTDVAGATAKHTAEMKTQSTFTGWLFPDVWSINASINNGYPYLSSLVP